MFNTEVNALRIFGLALDIALAAINAITIPAVAEKSEIHKLLKIDCWYKRVEKIFTKCSIVNQPPRLEKLSITILISGKISNNKTIIKNGINANT